MPDEHDLDAIMEELAALVGADPSPEFAPRLREQIAAASLEPRRLGVAWVFVPLAVATSILAAVALMQTSEPTAVLQRSVQQSHPPLQKPATFVPATRTRRDALDRLARHGTKATPPIEPHRNPLISAADVESPPLLIAGISDGGPDLDILERGGAMVEQAIEVKSVTLEPIRVDALQPIPPLEGAHP